MERDCASPLQEADGSFKAEKHLAAAHAKVQGTVATAFTREGGGGRPSRGRRSQDGEGIGFVSQMCCVLARWCDTFRRWS